MMQRIVMMAGIVMTLGSSVIGAPIDKQQFLQNHSGRAARVFAPAISLSSFTYVEFALSDDGKFTIGTVAGDPNRSGDDNKKLIFGHPNPSTSDTMVRVDGQSFSIHSGVPSGISSITNGLSVTLDTANVQIIEQLSMITSEATGNPDTIRVYFKVLNTDSVSHDVSLRTQLDTQLGSNDGAPFRVPNVGSVTHDTEFTPAGSVPSQALVLDNLVNPNIVALMSFRPSGYQDPDRVVLGYWPTSVGSYDYTVNPANSFLDNDNDGTISGSSPDSDSSVVIYWGYPDPSAFTLAPGDFKEFAFDYGMGNCTTASGNPFNLLFCAPAQINGLASAPTYTYTPVTVSAFLTNASGAAVAGGQATLNFTPDFKLVSGYAAARPIEFSSGSGSLGVGETAQIDWQITSNGRILGLRQLSLTATAGQRTFALRPITVTTIPNLLYGLATDADGNPVAGAGITVLLGGAIVGTATTQADGTYIVQGLPPGEYTVRLSLTNHPDSYFQAYVSATADSGRTGNPTAFSAASQLTTYSYPNPVREGRARITFFTESAQTADVQIFSTAGQLIKTLSLDTPGAGWHVVEWPIDEVANGVYMYQVKVGSQRGRGKIAVLKRRGI